MDLPTFLSANEKMNEWKQEVDSAVKSALFNQESARKRKIGTFAIFGTFFKKRKKGLSQTRVRGVLFSKMSLFKKTAKWKKWFLNYRLSGTAFLEKVNPYTLIVYYTPKMAVSDPQIWRNLQHFWGSKFGHFWPLFWPFFQKCHGGGPDPQKRGHFVGICHEKAFGHFSIHIFWEKFSNEHGFPRFCQKGSIWAIPHWRAQKWISANFHDFFDPLPKIKVQNTPMNAWVIFEFSKFFR